MSFIYIKNKKIIKNYISLQVKAKYRRRASKFIFNEVGSITIEASIVLPIFLFAFLSLLSIFRIINVYENVFFSLVQTSDDVVKQIYLEQNFSKDKNIEVNDLLVYSLAVANLNKYLDKSDINDINLFDVRYCKETNEIDLKVICNVKVEVPFFKENVKFTVSNIRQKLFDGYDYKNDKEEYVLVALSSQNVYHINQNCSHIKRKILKISKDSIKKYSKCKLCGNKESNNYYITSDGNCYHTSISCSSLKRMIIFINKKDLGNRRLCERCASFTN